MSAARPHETRTQPDARHDTGAPAPLRGGNMRGTDGVAAFALARVSGVVESAILVEMNGGTHAARQAASCLLTPAPGDIVVCATSRLGVHVVHVLERDTTDSATLCAPGVRRLVLEQPAIDIRTQQLDATVVRARARVEQVHLFTRVASAVAGRLEVVADRLRRIAGHETTSTGDSVRTVRNTDTVRAGHILHEASEVMSLRSHVAVVEARGDVRVNGERISMG